MRQERKVPAGPCCCEAGGAGPGRGSQRKLAEGLSRGLRTDVLKPLFPNMPDAPMLSALQAMNLIKPVVIIVAEEETGHAGLTAP